MVYQETKRNTILTSDKIFRYYGNFRRNEKTCRTRSNARN